MEHAKDEDEQVQEYVGEEEEPPAALVDHPEVPFVLPCARLVAILAGRADGGHAHETLQPNTF